MKLWMQDPKLVAPFSRPFVTPSQLARAKEEKLNAQSHQENPPQSPFVKGGGCNVPGMKRIEEGFGSGMKRIV